MNESVNSLEKDDLSVNLTVPQVLPEHIREVFAKATCLYSKSEVDSALDRLATSISYSPLTMRTQMNYLSIFV